MGRKIERRYVWFTISMLGSFIIAAFAIWNIDKPLDPETATLKQVLAKSIAAMDGVNSYRSHGGEVNLLENGSVLVIDTRILEVQNESSFSLFMRNWEQSPSNANANKNEIRRIGNQVYYWLENSDWVELEVDPAMMRPPSDEMIWELKTSNAVLASRSDLTESGRIAYRVVITKDVVGVRPDRDLLDPWEPRVVQAHTTTYLIDRESYKILTRIVDRQPSTKKLPYLYGDRPFPDVPWRFVRTDYYDSYDEPIVIVPPNLRNQTDY